MNAPRYVSKIISSIENSMSNSENRFHHKVMEYTFRAYVLLFMLDNERLKQLNF